MSGGTGFKFGVGNSLLLEGKNLLKGFIFAAKASFSNIMVESDSISLISLLNSSAISWSLIGIMVEDIKALAASLDVLSFSFIRKCENFVTHRLAKEGHLLASLMYWLDEPPLYLWDIFFANLS